MRKKLSKHGLKVSEERHKYTKKVKEFIYSFEIIKTYRKVKVFDELFSHTVSNLEKDNVSLFESNTTDEDVIETLTRAELLNRVKDNGINAMISEGGSNFSGGEKQRIGIARALLRDSDVLFLDETTSALDTAKYQKIEELFLSMKDKTIITVTHRLDEDILKGYDKIIAFKNGTVVEEGTFEDLIVMNGYFKLLYDSQIS